MPIATNPYLDLEVDVTVEAGGWASLDRLQAISDLALGAAVNLSGVRLPADAEVSVVFHDDKGVQALNKEWRDQDKPTNVLSFAANEGGGPTIPLLGDVILAFETIQREAREQGKDFEDHLTHLVIHGFLHLVGFDHVEEAEAEEMEALEIKILKALQIADPYEDEQLNVSNIAE